MTGSGGLSPAEHHLGDRLAALVDGELGHDSRERVLAHLATCWKCKAEADAQRRLKNVFAEAAPPPLSESLLARLQGLPAAGLDGGDGGDRGATGAGPTARDDAGREDAGRGRSGFGPGAETFALLPAVAAQRHERGFRVHRIPEPGPRPEPRSASRGRRFAFAAAGAVSLAAFALVGAQPAETPVGSPRARGGGPGVTTSSSTAGSRGASLVAAPSPAVRPGTLSAQAQPLGSSLLRPSGAPVLPPLVLTTAATTR
ncbi:zf-HC2 domain-containing protein [Streptomyces sp. NPDC049577]|uniref:zf-HC2 domain-containing protein n=1 Tax=Streptomyces sp. NPDC049577 TaxID=3155153 RepID=UPI0034405EA7